MLKKFKEYAKVAEAKRVKKYELPVKITDNVYIGSIDSVDSIKLKELMIYNIVISGKELKNEAHNNFNILELDLDDSFEQEIIYSVKKSYEFIKNVINIGGNVLIHCYSGISRSGSILIGYIMIEKKMRYNDAYNFIKVKYPKLFPNKNFEKQLKEFESEIIK
jgi:protein-tyrosine phosphatase